MFAERFVLSDIVKHFTLTNVEQNRNKIAENHENRWNRRIRWNRLSTTVNNNIHLHQYYHSVTVIVGSVDSGNSSNSNRMIVIVAIVVMINIARVQEVIVALI